jgi:hypothetical protein
MNRIKQSHIDIEEGPILIALGSGFQGKKKKKRRERCWHNPLVTLSITSNQSTLGVGKIEFYA